MNAATVPRRDFPPDEFVTVRDVPVFSEHETTTRKGRRLRFGRRELAAIVDRCNQRIRDTGDYAALAVGHTQDPEMGDTSGRPLVGFAGPFRLGSIHDRGTTKAAILADFRVFREDAAKLKKFPRRSAELWIADDYREMFLDPISLLGAESPRLDLGLCYSARRRPDGREVEVYSAACPSATNVYVPSMSAGKRRYAAVEGDPASTPSTPRKTPMALTDEDLQQIVAALEQLDWVQAVKRQLATQQAPGSDELDEISPDAAPERAAAGPPPDLAAPAPPALPPEDPRDKQEPALKYSKLFARLDQLERQLEQERGGRIDAQRQAKLAELRSERLFDLGEEAETCRYSKMSDAQFDEHVARIEKHYQRVPVGVDLAVFGDALPRPKPAQKQQYSKALCDRAADETIRRRDAGDEVEYATVLEELAKTEA